MRYYTSADDAAIAALDEANPISIRQNLEYGGLIYRLRDGRYGYTRPQRGTIHGFSLSTVHLPTGTTEVGNYHTHGDYSQPNLTRPGYHRVRPHQDTTGSLYFSGDDVLVARKRARIRSYRAYLGRPDGEYLFYEPGTNNYGKLPKRRPVLA